MTSNEPIVVKVANTPEQAKMFIALLEAEGIPAFTDGQTVQDEFAMSQKLMNLIAVKVMVPASAAERAREILAPTEIDPEELAAQALAAAPDPSAQPSPSPKTRTGISPWWWIVAAVLLLAIVAYTTQLLDERAGQ